MDNFALCRCWIPLRAKSKQQYKTRAFGMGAKRVSIHSANCITEDVRNDQQEISSLRCSLLYWKHLRNWIPRVKGDERF